MKTSSIERAVQKNLLASLDTENEINWRLVLRNIRIIMLRECLVETKKELEEELREQKKQDDWKKLPASVRLDMALPNDEDVVIFVSNEKEDNGDCTFLPFVTKEQLDQELDEYMAQVDEEKDDICSSNGDCTHFPNVTKGTD